MIRRFAAVSCALVCAAAFTACSTFTDNDVAASIDGDEFTRDTFEEFLRADAGDADVVSGSRAAGELTRFVYGAAIRKVLDGAEVQLTDEDRNGYTSQLPTDAPFFSYSSRLQTAVLYREVGAGALQRVPSPSNDELAARYAERPASIGLACYEAVTVGSSGQATSIAQQLREGATLAEAAGPDAEIRGPGAECASFDRLWGGLEEPEVVAGLIDARPGVPTVVDVENGWVVVSVQTYEAARDAIEANFPQAPGALLAIGLLATGDITIDPAYGRWDPARGSVVTA